MDVNLSLSGSPTFASAFTLTTGTLTLNSLSLTCASFASSNANVRSIVGPGTIKLTATGGAWSNTTVTNFTISGNPLIEYTNSSGTARNASFGAHTEANSPDLLVSAGTGTVNLQGSVRNVSFTGFTGQLAISAAATIYGNYTLHSAMTVTASALSTTFGATSGTKTITSAGLTMDHPIIINGAGGTFQLADALTMGTTRAFTLTNGIFNAVTFAVTIGSYQMGAGTKTLALGSGLWTCRGAFNANSNVSGLTVTGTSIIDMTSASAKTFSGGEITTWPTLRQAGAGVLTIAQSNTFTALSNSVNGATVRFTAGTTQTVTNFNLSGISGSLITIDSTSAGSAATLSKASGTVNASWLSISDITATGGATWNATNSIDGGGNSGINFILPGGSVVPGMSLGLGFAL